MTQRGITVVGAGILGLWQALVLARAGHKVRLVEASREPFVDAASSHAGAMLAPDCEAEAAPDLVREFGHLGLSLWRAVLPGLVNHGTLVVAAARDLPDLTQFSSRTGGYKRLTEEGIAALEPDLGHRFPAALFFPVEAHMTTPDAMSGLLEQGRAAGVETSFGEPWSEHESTGDETIVDCRGLAARTDLKTLRGVRGERLLVRTPDVTLSRPVRLLHPRHPVYVVPWSGHRFLVGSTMIESEDAGPISVRSALELLGAVYTLHPAFAEAEILEAAAGVRPAFPDNVPRAVVREAGRRILVNGAYRHGFLLAPVLAEAVAAYIASGAEHALLLDEAA